MIFNFFRYGLQLVVLVIFAISLIALSLFFNLKFFFKVSSVSPK